MQRWSTQPLAPKSQSHHLPPHRHHHHHQRLEPIRPDQRPVGRLPLAVWLSVMKHATLPDVRTLALTCKSLAALAKNDAVWDFKLALLDFAPDLLPPKAPAPTSTAEASFSPSRSLSRSKKRASQQPQPQTQPQQQQQPSALLEDFGEFEEAPLNDDNDLLKFDAASAGQDLSQPVPSTPLHQTRGASATSNPNATVAAAAAAATTGLAGFKQAYHHLLPFYTSLQTHTTSSILFTQAGLAPLDRALLLRSLRNLLLQPCAPSRSAARHTLFKRNLTSSQDFFESTLFADFERASKKHPQLPSGGPDEEGMAHCARLAWQLGPTSAHSLFDVFINAREVFYESSHNPHWNIVRDIGSTSATLDFAAMDSYMQYIIDTAKADGALAARVFPSQMNVVRDYAERVAQDTLSEYIAPLLSSAQSLGNPLFLQATAATFAQLMRLPPELMTVEPKSPRLTLRAAQDVIFDVFDQHMPDYLVEETDYAKSTLEGACDEWSSSNHPTSTIHNAQVFVGASGENPALAKRNFVSSFTKALMLPVTVGTQAVGAVTVGAFNAVVQIGQLTLPSGHSNGSAAVAVNEPVVMSGGRPLQPTEQIETVVESHKMQQLLSLDLTLQMIQAALDSLKRAQSFAVYPLDKPIGVKVRRAIEDIFIMLLQVLTERHMVPAFVQAERQMTAFNPADEDEGDQGQVAPLSQFFELVHVGDTIGQMIQVFFEKEMSAFIDKTDFLNAVVREKRKFETALDDSVATGLNSGVSLLMSEAEYLLTSKQQPADFCPDTDDVDLLPTEACRLVIDCLKRHCNMLKGCTDKSILEVFYVEIGMRLHALILKHLKKAMISPQGGFQVISDINAYHGFAVSLRQSAVVPYYTALKMVCNLYIVSSPKDLAGLVKDSARYEGTLRSEDAYELLQRRTDWRLLEKKVDKYLYGLNAEDCCVC